MMKPPFRGLTSAFSHARRAHRLHLTCDEEQDTLAVGIGCNVLLGHTRFRLVRQEMAEVPG